MVYVKGLRFSWLKTFQSTKLCFKWKFLQLFNCTLLLAKQILKMVFTESWKADVPWTRHITQIEFQNFRSNSILITTFVLMYPQAFRSNPNNLTSSLRMSLVSQVIGNSDWHFRNSSGLTVQIFPQGNIWHEHTPGWKLKSLVFTRTEKMLIWSDAFAVTFVSQQRPITAASPPPKCQFVL